LVGFKKPAGNGIAKIQAKRTASKLTRRLVEVASPRFKMGDLEKTSGFFLRMAQLGTARNMMFKTQT